MALVLEPEREQVTFVNKPPDSESAGRPLRVLHVIPGIASRYGGPSTAVAAMCSALARRPGVRPELATTDADGPGERLAPDRLPAGLTVHLFPRTCSERWKFSAGLWRWLYSHAGDYDVLHVHSLWSFASAAAGYAARRAGVPYVVRPAGMLSSYTWRRGGLKNRVYWRVVERRTVMKAAAVHATSREEADDVRAIRPRLPPHVIPNGVEAAAFTTPVQPEVLRARCGPAAGNRPILLYLSRLHPKKGITDLLLPALAGLRADCFLAIAGGADPHLPGHEAEVRTAIERLGLSGRVALLGDVTHEARWALFDGAAGFVLPSHSENFGIVVAEAMARGCPVVITEAVNASEHVTACGAGWVVTPTPEGVAGGLSACLSDPGLARAAGQRGRAYARTHLDWDVIAARIERMYRDCLR